MNIAISLILFGAGLFIMFVLKPGLKKKIEAIQTVTTVTVKELYENTGLLGTCVKLIAESSQGSVVKTPYSKREVAFYKAKLLEVVELKESSSNNKKNRRENVLEETSSNRLTLTDGSCNAAVEIDLHKCKLDLNKTLDKFEFKDQCLKRREYERMSRKNTRYNNANSEVLGYTFEEYTIENGEPVFVMGQAMNKNGNIYIGKPDKQDFIVSTRSEEQLVNKYEKNAMLYTWLPYLLFVVGVIMLFIKL